MLGSAWDAIKGPVRASIPSLQRDSEVGRALVQPALLFSSLSLRTPARTGARGFASDFRLASYTTGTKTIIFVGFYSSFRALYGPWSNSL